MSGRFRSYIFIVLQFILFGAVYHYARQERVGVLLTGGIFGTVLYLIIAYFEIRDERWYFSPVSAWCTMSIFHLGLIPIYLYFVIFRGEGDALRLGSFVIEAMIPLSYSYAILATLSFYIGAKIAEQWVFNRALLYFENINADYNLKARWAVFLIAFSWICYALFRAGVPLRAAGQIINYILAIPLITPFFIFVSRHGFSSDGQMQIFPVGKRIALAFGAVAAYVLLMAFGSGMRSPFLNILILFVWGYLLQDELRLKALSPWVRAKSISKMLFLAGSAAGLVVFLIVPFGKEFARQLEVEQIRIIEENITDIGGTFPDRGVWKLPGRMSAAIQGGAACLTISEYFPINVKTVDNVLIGIVPRIFWPEKPFISKGAYFAIFIREDDTRKDSEGTTALAMSAYGELYWSYGVKGIVIGMALLGLFFTFTFKAFSFNMPTSILRVLISTNLIIGCFHWFEADASANFVALAFYWIVFSPFVIFNVQGLLKLSPRKSRRLRAAARPVRN